MRCAEIPSPRPCICKNNSQYKSVPSLNTIFIVYTHILKYECLKKTLPNRHGHKHQAGLTHGCVNTTLWVYICLHVHTFSVSTYYKCVYTHTGPAVINMLIGVNDKLIVPSMPTGKGYFELKWIFCPIKNTVGGGGFNI